MRGKLYMNHNNQRGAVSLFIVVFAALLITVVTVSFIRIVINNQQQASTADLSQSAYDSAQAGVEDAKRALINLQAVCNGSNPAACTTALTHIQTTDCNKGLMDVVSDATSGDEVKVQEGTDTNTLDQAYTCVKINLLTNNYIGSLGVNESTLVPLTGVSSFDTVQIQWYSSSDLSTNKDLSVDLQPIGSTPLLAQSSWVSNRPPIMRTQLMQFGSNGFKLADFDGPNAAGDSDANTLFLYPSGNTGTANSLVGSTSFKGHDTRKTPTGTPLSIVCSGLLNVGGYACNEQITLPDAINAGQRTAFLRLSSLYNKASYSVQLLSGGLPVQFNGVQPEIDSTGRAGGLFRRVVARTVLSDANFPYPSAAVDVTGSFCKNFVVTDNAADYRSACTP